MPACMNPGSAWRCGTGGSGDGGGGGPHIIIVRTWASRQEWCLGVALWRKPQPQPARHRVGGAGGGGLAAKAARTFARDRDRDRDRDRPRDLGFAPVPPALGASASGGGGGGSPPDAGLLPRPATATAGSSSRNTASLFLAPSKYTMRLCRVRRTTPGWVRRVWLTRAVWLGNASVQPCTAHRNDGGSLGVCMAPLRKWGPCFFPGVGLWSGEL
jgi:hypothetical protein